MASRKASKTRQAVAKKATRRKTAAKPKPKPRKAATGRTAKAVVAPPSPPAPPRRAKAGGLVTPRAPAAARALSATMVEAVPGTRLTLKAAAVIVRKAANGFAGDIDSTLEQAGLITEAERALFRRRVFEDVVAAGCHISPGAIPNEPATKLSEARDAIQSQAS